MKNENHLKTIPRHAFTPCFHHVVSPPFPATTGPGPSSPTTARALRRSKWSRRSWCQRSTRMRCIKQVAKTRQCTTSSVARRGPVAFLRFQWFPWEIYSWCSWNQLEIIKHHQSKKQRWWFHRIYSWFMKITPFSRDLTRNSPDQSGQFPWPCLITSTNQVKWRPIKPNVPQKRMRGSIIRGHKWKNKWEMPHFPGLRQPLRIGIIGGYVANNAKGADRVPWLKQCDSRKANGVATLNIHHHPSTTPTKKRDKTWMWKMSNLNSEHVRT